MSAIVVDESHTVEERRTLKQQLKSEDRAIRKNTTSCKQHLKSRAQRQNIHGQSSDKETTNQGSLVCSCPDPGSLVGKDQRN